MSQIQVELQEWMGSDRSIAESAWTSSLDYQKKQTKTDQDVERVVKMLSDNKHSTPFESVVLKFWIKMPIQTDRQHMTHRIGSHNGMSGRYRTMPNEFLNIPDDVKEISLKSASKLYGHNESLEIDKYYKVCSEANYQYNALIRSYKQAELAGYISNNEYKRVREFYRGMLPQNNMTERVTIFNLRSFSNYIKLRDSEHAQPEIQKVAQLMLEEVKNKNICPIALKYLEENNWNI